MKDCEDCIWYGKEKPGQCGNYLCRNQSEYDPRFGIEGEREEEAVSDYIKRADVLELVVRGNLVSNRNYKSVMRLIMGIPAADVRPVVRGKWIVRDNPRTGWYRVNCSECGEDVTSVIPVIGFFPNAKPSWDFCPNCGAMMEGE